MGSAEESADLQSVPSQEEAKIYCLVYYGSMNPMENFWVNDIISGMSAQKAIIVDSQLYDDEGVESLVLGESENKNDAPKVLGWALKCDEES